RRGVPRRTRRPETGGLVDQPPQLPDRLSLPVGDVVRRAPGAWQVFKPALDRLTMTRRATRRRGRDARGVLCGAEPVLGGGGTLCGVAGLLRATGQFAGQPVPGLLAFQGRLILLSRVLAAAVQLPGVAHRWVLPQGLAPRLQPGPLLLEFFQLGLR